MGLSTGKLLLSCRKYVVSCKQTEVPLSVPWDQSNKVGCCPLGAAAPWELLPPALPLPTPDLLPLPQVYLSYNNVSALKTLIAKANWALAREKEKVLNLPRHPKMLLTPKAWVPWGLGSG